MNKNINDITKYLFDRDYLKVVRDQVSITEEKEEEYENASVELIKMYGWNDVFDSWTKYLYTECTDAEKTLEFAFLFYNYKGQEQYIPDPYKFLAYFYYRIDMDKYHDEAMTILDSISIEILHRAGISNVYYDENPYYVPETDPKIIEEIEKWKAREKK